MKKLKIILLSNYFYLILIFILIIYLIICNLYGFKSKYVGNETKIKGYIVNYYIKDNNLVMDIIAKEKIRASYSFKDNNEIVFFKNNYKLNDYILLEGLMSKPYNNTNFNQFNYKKYLYNNDIFYLFEIKNYKKLKNNDNFLYLLKNKMIDKTDNYKDKTKEYLNSFVLGNNKYLEENVQSKIQELGVSHLFAVSGMHVSFFILMFSFIFEKLRFNEYIYKFLIFIFLIFYLFITNYSIGILRSTIMYLFLFLNKNLKLNISNIKLLIINLFIVLLFKPKYIFNVSFQFSYVICLFLFIFSKYINRKHNYFIKLLLSSFVASIFSFPIVIYNYSEINILSIFINMFFIPLISYFIFPFTILVYIFPFFEHAFLLFINAFELLLDFMSNIKVVLLFRKLHFIFYFFYYFLIFIFLLGFFNNKKFYCIFLIFYLFFHYYYNYIFNNNFYIIYDVGQGDSSLLYLNNQSLLIDTGCFKTKNILNNIKSLGIRKIDYLVLTHGDFDHMGEAINLVENFKVENVIFNCGEYNDLEKELIKVLDKKKIMYYSCIKELNIDNNKLYFLQTKEYDNENDNSNVIHFNYEGYKFLFMGDAGVEKEKDILEKYNLSDIDFLKVGHHGSNTSSSEYFIDSINTKYSLISVGKNNRYGHPKDEVLVTLKNSKIYRTDLDGSIEIKLNKKGYKIRTCPP